MSASIKLALITALRRILEPLAGLMIEAGIGVGDFHAISKAAFVKAARERTVNGRMRTISAIAVMTGLRRAEVRALLEKPDVGIPQPERNRHRAERVLSGWWSDVEFLDEDGRPMPLAPSGMGATFESLARRYSGDPRLRSLITELLRAKAVVRLADGRLQPVSRTFSTARWDPDGVLLMGERIRDLVSTIVYNLRHAASPRYIRTVMSETLPADRAPILVRDITQSLNVLSDTYDEALNSTIAEPGEAKGRGGVRLGFTVFLFEEALGDQGELKTTRAPDEDRRDSVASGARTGKSPKRRQTD